jgi:hypothetical protein
VALGGDLGYARYARKWPSEDTRGLRSHRNLQNKSPESKNNFFLNLQNKSPEKGKPYSQIQGILVLGGFFVTKYMYQLVLE